MKISLNKKELKKCFLYLSKVVNKKAKASYYHNIQFVNKNNVLFFYAFNGEIIARSVYGNCEASDFNFMIEFHTLYSLLSLSEEDVVMFDISSNKVNISTSENKYTLALDNENDFEFIFDSIQYSKEALITNISGENLEKASAFCLASLQEESVASRFKGFFFDGTFVTTDDSSLAVFPYVEKIKSSVFIPRDAFLILNSFNKESMISLYNSDGKVIAEIEDAIFILPKMANAFPNYENIITRCNDLNLFFELDKEKFIKSCSRLLLFTDNNVKQSAVFDVNEKGVFITSISENKEANEHIVPTDIKITKAGVSFRIDLKKLQSRLSQIEGDSIRIMFSEKVGLGSPVIIKGESKEFYIMTLLFKQ